MTDEPHPQPDAANIPASNTPTDPPDAALETLRQILLRENQHRLAEVEKDIELLEKKVTDRSGLIATISPVLGEVIRHQIKHARDEMIEALYPIIGQLVVRAVSEAVQDLARKVDAQVRRSFDVKGVLWRLRARLGGASQAEVALRSSLPFIVREVFFIHRETGILLQHTSGDGESGRDSELISSMLTAIRDFTQDAFGRGEGEHLEEIEYGDESILIEVSSHAYLAVVITGIEPPGYRERMRTALVDLEHEYADNLSNFDGDTSIYSTSTNTLPQLMAWDGQKTLSHSQILVLVLIGLLFLLSCAALSYGGHRWLATVHAAPVPEPLTQVIVVTATGAPTTTPEPTLTPAPTQTAIPSSTPTLTPTSAPTASVTPQPTTTPLPESVERLMIGSAWLREDPQEEAALLDLVAIQGEWVEILAVYDTWARIRWEDGQQELTGWVSTEWVDTQTPFLIG